MYCCGQYVKGGTKVNIHINGHRSNQQIDNLAFSSYSWSICSSYFYVLLNFQLDAQAVEDRVTCNDLFPVDTVLVETISFWFVSARIEAGQGCQLAVLAMVASMWC